MTDDELEGAIARAVQQPEADGLPELVALRDRLQRERDPLDPWLGRMWDALVRVAHRSPDAVDDYLGHAEGRARWLAVARGPAHRDTLRAWIDLGKAADLESCWEIATRAWEAVVEASPADPDRETQVMLSTALHGLGIRRFVAGRLADARALLERDLAVTERLYPGPHAQLAFSLGNLAYADEELGDHQRALQLRQRQRDVLAATGASARQLADVDERIARLSAS
jgi:hypothetical protein